MIERLVRSKITDPDYNGIRYTLYGYNGNDKKDRIFLSGASYIIYKKKDFDWIHIVDVITNERYRGRRYAPSILRVMLLDIRKKFPKGASLFLLVDRENPTAIKIYLDLGFEIRFSIYNDGVNYYVMTLSTQRSVKQLKSINLLNLY